MDTNMNYFIHQGKRIEYLLLKSDRPVQTRLTEMGSLIKDMANEASVMFSERISSTVKTAESKGYVMAHKALDTKTKRELYTMAQELEIDGRSTMDKEELIKAILAK